MLEYETGDETLAAIAGRYGITAEQVRPLPAGVANRVFLLGDDLVLRVPRTERFLPDLVKEAGVIPAALGAGVRTPEVVAFDDTCSVVDVPYMVLARAPGADLACLDQPIADTGPVFHQVGRELAKLHRLSPATAPDLPAVPVEDGAEDPWTLTDRLLVAGWIDAEAARWLTGWFDRLSARLPADPGVVLVHGDVAPQNLLVVPGTARLSGIVDWGDAQWADPAADFAKMPLTGIPAMLDGYRRETGEATSTSTPAWEARVLWFHLTWALGRLADPVPHPGERHWTAPSSRPAPGPAGRSRTAAATGRPGRAVRAGHRDRAPAADQPYSRRHTSGLLKWWSGPVRPFGTSGTSAATPRSAATAPARGLARTGGREHGG
ncbi:phosphotransferase family protein [Sphaerisporangium fuscum]|uniref:phosphotransferase family protein n=1 Tax=Sphaerisporangium fuscum TaxID=2835868 RepID=UPI001BDC6DA4|nr:phosphotransferase [Sphaerisporangium fuscum]